MQDYIDGSGDDGAAGTSDGESIGSESSGGDDSASDDSAAFAGSADADSAASDAGDAPAAAPPKRARVRKRAGDAVRDPLHKALVRLGRATDAECLALADFVVSEADTDYEALCKQRYNW